MSVIVTIDLNGVRVPLTLDEAAIASIAAALTNNARTQERSPYMTIPEAAEYLRCTRQRVDDLLSQGRLSRVKEGRRTLVARTEIDAHANNRRERA